MHLIDWLIVILLNGAVIGVGFYLARGTKSSSDWFLGKRALPFWAVGLSMFATNVDNADIVSITGKTFNEGLHIITVYALGSAVGGILAAFFVTPAMYRAGFYTNAEYLEARYGAGTRVLSALIQIQYRSSMLGLMIYSVFLLLTGLQIVGPTNAWVLIVSMVIFSGIYTSWGGLRAVVWTDAMQAIVMMIGGAVIFYAVWNAVGGWSGMETQFHVSERTERFAAPRDVASTVGTIASPFGQGPLSAVATFRPGMFQTTPYGNLPHIGSYDGGDAKTSPYIVSIGDWSANFGPYVVVIAWMIIASGYWTVNHTQTMRLMGSRSLWDMKMAAVAGVLFSLPIMIVSACLGIFGRALSLQNAGAESWQAVSETADLIYPLLANEYLVVGLKGLVVAGIFAAAISTFDSMGSALSAVFTRDIYARLIVKERDDRHYVFVGRCATVAVLLLGFGYLPFILLQKNMLDAFTTLIPVFVTPLFTIYVLGVLTRAHRRSGLIGLLCGSTYGLFALYCREAHKIAFLPNVQDVPLWLVDRWAALIWSLLITSATMAIATAILGWQTRDEFQRFHEKGWLESSRETLPPLREHPFRNRVPWWLEPKWYAILLLILSCWVVFGLFW